MSKLRSQITKYSIGLTILSLIVGVGGFYVLYSVLNSPITGVYPFLVCFVFTVTLFMHIILARAVNQKPAAFINRFMLGSSVKLFVYLIFMVVYALLKREQAVHFVLTFFLLYIIYTFYDITMSNRFFRKGE